MHLNHCMSLFSSLRIFIIAAKDIDDRMDE